MFKERIENSLEEEEPKERTIEKKWEKMKETVKEALVKEERRVRRKKLGYKEWWDRGCTKEKRKLVRTYKKWKSGKMNREDYKEEKKRVKAYMKEKIKKKKEEEEEELRNLKSETEVWRYINKRRGRRKGVENNISRKEWKSYFMKLLESREEEEHDKKEEEKRPEMGKKRKRRQREKARHWRERK